MAESLEGTAASPGVAVGRVMLLDRGALPVVPLPVPPERVHDEVERFRQALDQGRSELEGLRDRTRAALGEPYARMLETQLLILGDPSLFEETVTRIKMGRVAASWALKEAVAGFIRRLEALDEIDLRERGGDLRDVHRRLQRLLRGVPRGPDRLPPGPLILVAHALGPSDALSHDLERVVGVAADVGGPASHTAILTQALSLPAVVGLRDISVRVRAGDPMIVDGDAARVLWRPTPPELDEARRRRSAWLERDRRLVEARDTPAETLDGVEVTIRANIELPQQADAAVRYGAKGIGLYRSEFLFLAHAPRIPHEDEHYRVCRELAAKVAPHPTFVRALDLGGAKEYRDARGQDPPNPVFGLRGIRFCLSRPDIFAPQLRAVLRAAAHADIRLILPMVTHTDEIRQVRRLIEREADALRARGEACRPDIPLGIMIEVPAAAATADLLAREVDFTTIGTNDLIQYALAVDRDSEESARLASPLHPAVLRMIRFVVGSGRDAGVPVALCGEMAADPLLADILVGLGLRELSVRPGAVPAIRTAVRGIDSRAAARTAEQATVGATEPELAPGRPPKPPAADPRR